MTFHPVFLVEALALALICGGIVWAVLSVPPR